MTLELRDTIFAPSSGLGRAAVTVVRLSGPRVRFVLETLAGDLPEPRRLSRRLLKEPRSGEPLDDALVVYFPGPGSFTGEDCGELQIHGSSAVRAAVLRVLATFPGCRLAKAGEFTRRAFENGKLDLSAVEGLADLIDSETEAQRRQALRQLEGHLGDAVRRWMDALIRAMALCEALIDFSDEGDVDGRSLIEIRDILSRVGGEIEQELKSAPRGERVREGFRVAITGPVNAGKSTLLNALARRDVAIVSDVPGTTRDAVEVRLDLQGLPVLLIDTAGFRETQDPVEKIGIARAKAIADDADLVVHVSPANLPVSPRDGIRVGTKGDLFGDLDPASFDAVVSARMGDGLEGLLVLIYDRLVSQVGASEGLVTRQRHRVALQESWSALTRCEPQLKEETLELAAEDLRLALRHLGEVVGSVGVEHILDQIFSSFCIGK